MSEHENAPGRQNEHDQLTSDLDAARQVDVQSKLHTGSQNVRGYRPQSPQALALVNEVKVFESNIAGWLTDVYFRDASDGQVSLDPRQVASARSHFEYALYHLNRAIFQPADPIGDAVKEGPR